MSVAFESRLRKLEQLAPEAGDGVGQLGFVETTCRAAEHTIKEFISSLIVWLALRCPGFWRRCAAAEADQNHAQNATLATKLGTTGRDDRIGFPNVSVGKRPSGSI